MKKGRHNKEIDSRKLTNCGKCCLSKGGTVFFSGLTNLQQKENKASGVPVPQFTESEREKKRERE